MSDREDKYEWVKYSNEQIHLIQKYFDHQPSKGGCLNSDKVMTDEEYLSIVIDKKNSYNLKERALNKLGIDVSEVNEIEPIEILGFSFDEKCKIGPSGKYSNLIEVSWIFCSNVQVYVYNIVFDMISENMLESCREYFYNDITAITTIDKKIEFNHTYESGCMKNVNNVKTFKYVSYFSIIVPSAEFSCAVSDMNRDIEPKVRALKSKIRDKKCGEQTSLF